MANIILDNVTINQPVANTAARNSIPTTNLSTGCVVFQTDESQFYFWNGSSWNQIGYVIAPVSSISNSIAIFSDTSGHLIVNSNLIINADRITGFADPIDPQDAMTLAYADANYAPITVNGNVIGAASSTTGNLPVFADTSGKVLGASAIGTTGGRLTGVANPVNAQDVVTKSYGDATYGGGGGGGDVTGVASSEDEQLAVFNGTTGKAIKNISVLGSDQHLSNLTYAQQSDSAVSLQYLQENYSVTNNRKTPFSVLATNAIGGTDTLIFQDELISLYYDNVSTYQFYFYIRTTGLCTTKAKTITQSTQTEAVHTNNFDSLSPSVKLYFSSEPYPPGSASDLSMAVQGTSTELDIWLVGSNEEVHYNIKGLNTLKSTGEFSPVNYVMGYIEKTVLAYTNYFTFTGSANGTISANSFPFSWGGESVNSGFAGYPLPSVGSGNNIRILNYVTQINNNAGGSLPSEALQCEVTINNSAVSAFPPINFSGGNAVLNNKTVNVDLGSGNSILNLKALNDVSGSNGYIITLFGVIYYPV